MLWFILFYFWLKIFQTGWLFIFHCFMSIFNGSEVLSYSILFFTLVSCFLSDLNVEHLQLILFIFHNFSLSQRKSLLTYCTRVLITVANSASVLHSTPMALGRLLLLLDYFLHNLSTPPEELFKQVCVRSVWSE